MEKRDKLFAMKEEYSEPGHDTNELDRVKRDYDQAYWEKWYYHGHQELTPNNPILAELKEAGLELEAGEEKKFHFEWRIIDCDESHIYVTNKTNGHRYHISVVWPAWLYVDIYRIREDGTEVNAFAEE